MLAILGVVRRIGPFWLKKLIWNVEFSRGRWVYLHPPNNLVTSLLQLMGPDSSLLDLGCGNGELASCLRSQGWRGPYTGVDISSEGLRFGIERNLPSCRWVNADIGDFSSDSRYDSIVMIESLYYLRLEQAESLLLRLKALLTPAGCLIIRIHDSRRHSAYLAAIEKVYPAAKKFSTGSGQAYFLHRNQGSSEYSSGSS